MTDKKIPCYVLIFFDYETIQKSLDCLVKYSSRLDISIVENFSDYTQEHIKPYVLDLLNQGKINKYFLFDENIVFNAIETVLKHDREELLEKHNYFILTDGDLTTQDTFWIDEQLAIMVHPEVIVSGVRLDLSNLPSTDKYPDADKWVPPAMEVANKNYLDGLTGWWLAMIRTDFFFPILDIIKNQKAQLSDVHMHQVLKHFNLKWVRTKKAQAYHLTWDRYSDLDHPYTIWKHSFSYKDLWHHTRYCGYKLFDKDKQVKYEAIKHNL